jgi:hypothetical protein
MSVLFTTRAGIVRQLIDLLEPAWGSRFPKVCNPAPTAGVLTSACSFPAVRQAEVPARS